MVKDEAEASVKELRYQSSISPRLLLCFMGYGVMTACAGPGLGLWPLIFVGLAPVFAQVYSQKDPNKTFSMSLCWMLGYGALSWSWIWGLYPLRWLGFTDWQSALLTGGAWLLAITYPALWTAIGFALLAWLWRQLDRLPAHSNIWKQAAFVALGVVVLGVSRSLLFQSPLGLKFTDPSLALAGLPGFRYWLPQVSSDGLFGLIMGVNALLGSVWAHTNREIQKPASRIFVTLAVLLVPGAVGVSHPSTPARPLPLAVWTVQGNLPIGTIRNPRRAFAAAQNRYITPLSHLPYQDNLLLVLPEEGAIPGWVPLRQPERNPGFRALQHQVTCHRFSLIVGVSLWDETARQAYNAMALLQPLRPPQFYRKRHLVPFGESLPWLDQALSRKLLKPLALDTLTTFSAGDNDPLPFSLSPPSATLSHKKGEFRIGPLVCLELLDTGKAMAYKARGANLLVVSSNLGWFQQAGPNRLLEAQYVAMAQLLAAETRLPVVISANAGPSVSVDTNGALDFSGQSLLIQDPWVTSKAAAAKVLLAR